MATEDSARAGGSLWPTGQGAGVTSSREDAMSAPGSDPASIPGRGDLGAVEVIRGHFAATNREDGGEPYEGAAWETVTGRDWPR
jgi:hypothetical protein